MVLPVFPPILTFPCCEYLKQRSCPRSCSDHHVIAENLLLLIFGYRDLFLIAFIPGIIAVLFLLFIEEKREQTILETRAALPFRGSIKTPLKPSGLHPCFDLVRVSELWICLSWIQPLFSSLICPCEKNDTERGIFIKRAPHFFLRNKSLSNENQCTSLRGTVQKQVEMCQEQIDFLRSLDTEEFYNKDEEEVRKYAQRTIQELIERGSQSTPALIDLLQTENTWSCFFALSILRQIKDPQAIPALIAFLQRETDDSLANEEAMFALQDIGDSSILPLVEDIQEAFDNKKYNSYLVDALTGIIGPGSFEFMVKITKDFIGKPWRYKGWFHIEDFTYNFVKQGRKDAIPLLRQILEIMHLNGNEKRELEDTIRALEDPIAYEKGMEETVRELSDATQTVDA